MKKVHLFFFLLISFNGLAQTDKLWFIEANTGFHAGWWMYNHGSSNPNIFADQGLDYSHFSSFLPFGLAAGHSFDRLSLALGASYTIYFDKELRRHTNAPSILSTYDIAEIWPRLIHGFLQIDYQLLQRKNFHLGPFAKLGWFKLLADPPRESLFSTTYFWQFGIQGTFKLGKGNLFFRPSYQENRTKINVPDLEGAENKIFSIGIEIGYRYALSNKHK